MEISEIIHEMAVKARAVRNVVTEVAQSPGSRVEIKRVITPNNAIWED